MTCEKCSTDCLNCKPKHHREQKTRRYNDIPGGITDGMMAIPNRLCVKLMNDDSLDKETRSELREWYIST